MKHIVAFSGGKNSTAMLIRMLELNMKIDTIVFADTTLEFPELHKYITKIEKYIKRKIIKVKPKKSFYDWFYSYPTKGKHKDEIRGMPWIVGHSWCCREFKINPQKDFRANKDKIVYLGIATHEKHRRQKNPYIKYPLIEWGWGDQKCQQYLRSKKLYNPLYKYFNRLGCWLCPKQSLNSLRMLYFHYPKMWQHLKKLEKDSPHGFRIDYSLDFLESKWKNKKLDVKR